MTTITASAASQVSLSSKVDAGETHMGVRLLGTVVIATQYIKNYKFAGLSALAWDQDEGILYAVSDLGKLFHLRPHIKNNRLHDVKITNAYALTDSKGKAVTYPWHDAEGLTLKKSHNDIKGDSQLLVSYERRPRIRYYNKNGKRLGTIRIPKRLRYRTTYQSSNKALEAITTHPRWGLLTAPEASLRNQKTSHLNIYRVSSRRHWSYALSNAPNSALVAMENLPDGSLLTLERAYISPFKPLIISLRRANLLESSKAALVEDVAVFSSRDGWNLDNFEGLAYHQNNRFFTISDDNDNFWQQTLLSYFELL